VLVAGHAPGYMWYVMASCVWHPTPPHLIVCFAANRKEPHTPHAVESGSYDEGDSSGGSRGGGNSPHKIPGVEVLQHDLQPVGARVLSRACGRPATDSGFGWETPGAHACLGHRTQCVMAITKMINSSRTDDARALGRSGPQLVDHRAQRGERGRSLGGAQVKLQFVAELEAVLREVWVLLSRVRQQCVRIARVPGPRPRVSARGLAATPRHHVEREDDAQPAVIREGDQLVPATRAEAELAGLDVRGALDTAGELLVVCAQ
jgi:hypothetical protein